MKHESSTQRNKASESALKRALKSCRSAFVSVGVFSFFINLLMLLPAIYMLQIYDRVMSSRSMETLAMITLIIVAMFAVLGVLQIIRSRILTRVSVRLDRDLSDRVFDAMFRESLVRPGSDSAQAMADATTLRQFLTGQGLLAFFDAPWIPIYLGVMFLFHFWLGVYGVIAVIILSVLAIINESVTRKPLAAANYADSEARRFAADNMRNAEVVHAMGMTPAVRERLGERQSAVIQHQTYASDRAGTFSHLSRTFRMGAQALAYGVGAVLAIQGEVSAGGIVAGAILLGQALRPVDQLIGGDVAGVVRPRGDVFLVAVAVFGGKKPDQPGQLRVREGHVRCRPAAGSCRVTEVAESGLSLAPDPTRRTRAVEFRERVIQREPHRRRVPPTEL